MSNVGQNDSKSRRYESRKRALFWVGIGGSLITLSIVIGFGYDRVWDFLRFYDLNLLGDFLAGLFAPLAFLWLVIGYFQQGLELEMQREQLELQRIESKRQADELKRQADAIGLNELHARKDIFFRMASRFESEAASVAAELLRSTYGEDWVAKSWVNYQSGDTSAFFDMLGRFVLDPGRRTYVRANVSRLNHITVLHKQIMMEVQKCDPDGSLTEMYSKTNLALLVQCIEELDLR